MIEDLQKKLEDSLKEYINKNITIIQEGFIESKYNINNVKYNIEEDILNIIDNEDKNYLGININQIYKIDNKEKRLKIYMDNDIQITIKN